MTSQSEASISGPAGAAGNNSFKTSRPGGFVEVPRGERERKKGK